MYSGNALVVAIGDVLVDDAIYSDGCLVEYDSNFP
jgi:hypothetical protein